MAGSIRQRGPTSWELRVLQGRDESTGKYRYVTKTFRGGCCEAERELARLVTDVDDGVSTANSGTVGALCEKWFEHAAPGLSPKVASEYRRLLDRHIIPKWGSTSLRRRPTRTGITDPTRRVGRAGCSSPIVAPTDLRAIDVWPGMSRQVTGCSGPYRGSSPNVLMPAQSVCTRTSAARYVVVTRPGSAAICWYR